jgi:hypothetical protein
MKTAKLLDKLGRLVESPQDLDRDRLKKLRKLVRELKDKQKKLEKELRKETDEEARHHIQRSIEVVRTQREKGAAVYKEIKRSSPAE